MREEKDNILLKKQKMIFKQNAIFSKRYIYILLVLSFLLIVFLSGCIELKPREGISTTIPVQITQGSDVCAGYNESTCGAFLKEKRQSSDEYICTGARPQGTLNRWILDQENKTVAMYVGTSGEDITVSMIRYKLLQSEGWKCTKKPGTTSLPVVAGKGISSLPIEDYQDCGGRCRNWALSADGEIPLSLSKIDQNVSAVESKCSLIYQISKANDVGRFQAIFSNKIIESPVYAGTDPNDCSALSLGPSYNLDLGYSLINPDNQNLNTKIHTCTRNMWPEQKQRIPVCCITSGIFSRRCIPLSSVESQQFCCKSTQYYENNCTSQINYYYCCKSSSYSQNNCTIANPNFYCCKNSYYDSNCIHASADTNCSRKYSNYPNLIAKYSCNRNYPYQVSTICNQTYPNLVEEKICPSNYPYSGFESVSFSPPRLLTISELESLSNPCGAWKYPWDYPDCDAAGCLGHGEMAFSGQFTLQCIARTVLYNSEWECTNSITNEVYNFTSCSESSGIATFQGGRTYLDNDTPFSELSQYLQSYYGTYSYNPISGETKPAGKIQVPFFMLGQGPTFQDYEEAKKLCVPWKETIVNISIGNTTFDPPFLTIPSGMELCFENKDKDAHSIKIIDLQNQETVRDFSIQTKASTCYKPADGFYHIKDSNGDYAYLSVVKETSTSNIYVGQRLIPNYTIVSDGGFVNFTLLERKEHNLSIRSINRFDDFKYENNITINLTNPVVTISAPKTGEYEIKDNITSAKAYLFVQSLKKSFLFKSDGSVDPNYEVYRPLGDVICFRSETSGLILNISRYTETEQGYEWVQLYEEPLPTDSYCCIQGVLPGKYQGITNDGRVVNWTIGTGKPSATINIQPIGFEPELLDSPLGTKICWINPTAASRDISTVSASTKRVFFSGSIPPLSDNVCWPTMNKTDSFTTTFVSPKLSIKQTLNIKEEETSNIQILQGGGGFDVYSTIVKPDSQVCWINNDNKNHTLKTETEDYIILQPSQTNCLPKENVINGALFWRELDGKGIYSYVGVMDGQGFMLSSKGIIPSNTFIQLPETNYSSDGTLIEVAPSYFTIINKQNVPSELYEIATATLTANSTGLAQLITYKDENNTDQILLMQNPIKTYTKVRLFVKNNDDKNHTVRVETTGDEVIIPSSSLFEFDLNQSVVLTDLTIKENLTGSGITNQTVIDAFSQIPVLIVGQGEIKLNKAGDSGDSIKLKAPIESMAVIFYENNTNSTIAVTFMDTKERISENPLNNVSLDLPVQVVHGDLSSDVLASMRKYADQGAMSMIVPSFSNVTVTIHSSVFSPETAEIPAGSTITFTNKDVVNHSIEINKTTNGVSQINTINLAPLQSNYTSDTPKNTTFIFYDHLSNMKGNITTVAYDALIGIRSTPIYPEEGMVYVGGPVKFNNYDSNSNYTVEIKFVNELNVEKTIRLNLPNLSNNLPGSAVWITDEPGNATYTIKSDSSIVGSGKIIVRNSIVNVSIRNGEFETKSISVDHQSKVCFVPDSTRNIVITNLDTNEKVAEAKIIPSGQLTDGSDICKKVYNCTAKPQNSNILNCTGQVIEGDTDTYCSYYYTNASYACQLNRTWNCVSKNPDMVCNSDYSKDTDSSAPGIQPQCLFTASQTGNACNGQPLNKPGTENYITCGPVDQYGRATFNYKESPSSLWMFTSSQPFCSVSYKDGKAVCSSTGPYKALGCLPTKDNSACYAVPFAQSGFSSTFVSNEFCNTNQVAQGTKVPAIEVITIYGTCESSTPYYCKSLTVCPEEYTRVVGPKVCVEWGWWCTGYASTTLCIKNISDRDCDKNNISTTGCSNPTKYSACKSARSGVYSYYTLPCFKSCEQKTLIQCPTTSCSNVVSSVTSDYPKTCRLTTAVSYIDPRYPGGRTLPGFNTCSYGGTTSQYPFACNNYALSQCPCLACQKNSAYASLGNFNCSIINDVCRVVVLSFNQDDGTYCKYNISEACIPKQGIEGNVLCNLVSNNNISSCAISQPPKSNKDVSGYCGLSPVDCQPAYEGVNCTFDVSSQSCMAKSDELFCFTPASTYLVEDVGSGDTMTIEGYDRYQPLNIDVQRAEFTQSLVETSPLSDVCFRSLDGKNHSIIVPEQISTENIIVKPTSDTCLHFPYNPEYWTVRLADQQDVSVGIKSIKKDIEIVVKNQMFNPSDLIVRNGTSITFVNTDSVSHTLNKSTPTINKPKINLLGEILVSDSFFSSITKSQWMDKTTCRNDSDCPSGTFCSVEGRCHSAKLCLKDEDCPTGSICNNYQCILAKKCITDSECGANYSCNNGLCLALTTSCQTDLDCPFGSICKDSKCTVIKNCSSSSDCPSGLACAGGICTILQTCTSNKDCPIDSACIQGICSTPPIVNCSTSSDCPTGLSCIAVDEDEGGNPIKACVNTTQQCQSNSNCSEADSLVCIQKFVEPLGNYCMFYNFSSLETNPICNSDLDCEQGSCNNSTCSLVKKCSYDSDCGSVGGTNLICDNFVCKVPVKCALDSNCSTGQTCIDGYCRSSSIKQCENDGDCDNDEVCSSFKCVKKQTCSASTQCINLQSGAACTNESSIKPAFCKSSTNCTSDAFCPSNGYCDTSKKQCIIYPKTTCDSPLYGSNVTQVNASFKLPATVLKAYLIYSFNDNGKVSLNGQEILTSTKYKCQYGSTYIDKFSQEATWKIPLSLLKKDPDVNNISVTVCSCSGVKGFNFSIYYQYITPQGITTESITIDPNSQKTITAPLSRDEFAYVDSQTLNALPVSVRTTDECGSDLSSMALGIASYERLDYATLACDSGRQTDCASYNPYGPATVAFLSSEAGLDLSNEKELNCSLAQLKNVKDICPNCTTVLNVGNVNITELSEILRKANESGNLKYVDVIGYDEFLNNYQTCSFEDIMNSIVNKSKLGLYNYSKPSIITRFGLKEGDSANSACNWTSESIVTAYQDFYGLWIPILAGSGVLGTAQYCLTDPCPYIDFYGLLTSGKTNKPYTDAWFREGCGRYYYAAEGLSFTTFSMKETNYSMCDPSRMLALLQSMQCAVGKYTLKTK